MDRAELPPLGEIRLVQATRLGIVPVYRARSTLALRWDVLHRHFGPVMTPYPKALEVIKTVVKDQGREVNISRGEFEQGKNILSALHQAWDAHVTAARDVVSARLSAWLKSSKRGYFQLVVLACAAVLQHRLGKEMGSAPASSKGFGSSIKRVLLEVSAGRVQAGPGSLYVALEKLEDDGLITHYKDGSGNPVAVTTRGRAFLARCMESISSLVATYDQTGILDRFGKGIFDQLVTFVTRAGYEIPGTVDMSTLLPRMKILGHGTSTRGTWQSGEDKDDATINNLHTTWLGNFNRGTIDLFVLGHFLVDGPSYGNRVIKQAKESLKVQAGTMYPKIAELSGVGFLEKLEGITQGTKVTSTQGPERQYHDITPAGAVFFSIAWGFFLNDVNALFKLLDELTDA